MVLFNGTKLEKATAMLNTARIQNGLNPNYYGSISSGNGFQNSIMTQYPYSGSYGSDSKYDFWSKLLDYSFQFIQNKQNNDKINSLTNGSQNNQTDAGVTETNQAGSDLKAAMKEADKTGNWTPVQGQLDSAQAEYNQNLTSISGCDTEIQNANTLKGTTQKEIDSLNAENKKIDSTDIPQAKKELGETNVGAENTMRDDIAQAEKAADAAKDAEITTAQGTYDAAMSSAEAIYSQEMGAASAANLPQEARTAIETKYENAKNIAKINFEKAKEVAEAKCQKAKEDARVTAKARCEDTKKKASETYDKKYAQLNDKKKQNNITIKDKQKILSEQNEIIKAQTQKKAQLTSANQRLQQIITDAQAKVNLHLGSTSTNQQ